MQKDSGVPDTNALIRWEQKRLVRRLRTIGIESVRRYRQRPTEWRLTQNNGVGSGIWKSVTYRIHNRPGHSHEARQSIHWCWNGLKPIIGKFHDSQDINSDSLSSPDISHASLKVTMVCSYVVFSRANQASGHVVQCRKSNELKWKLTTRNRASVVDWLIYCWYESDRRVIKSTKGCRGLVQLCAGQEMTLRLVLMKICLFDVWWWFSLRYRHCVSIHPKAISVKAPRNSRDDFVPWRERKQRLNMIARNNVDVLQTDACLAGIKSDGSWP